MFSKIGPGHVLSNPNMHHCAKNQKKLMMKSRENAQKTGFPGIFPAFSAREKSFYKIGLRRIFDIAILHLCAKFHEII